MSASEEPFTVQQLKALKPGESMVYYRGHLKDDIARSTGAYGRVLNAIRFATEELRKLGKIDILETLVPRQKLVRIIKDGSPALQNITWMEKSYKAIRLSD